MPSEMNANSLMSGLDPNAMATAAAVMQSFLNDPQNANSTMSFQSDSYNSDTSSNMGRDEDFDLDSESADSPNNSSLGNNALENFDD